MRNTIDRLLSRPGFVLIFFFCAFTAGSQVPQDSMVLNSASPKAKPHLYHINYWVTGAISVVGTVGDMIAIPSILHAKKPITDAEFAALNLSSVNGIDRWSLQQNPSSRNAFYKASDIALPVIIVASGAALALDNKVRQDWGNIMLMYYEMHAINFTLYNYSPFGPAFQNKFRPYAYYSEFPIEDRRSGGSRNSMYSGHVSESIASTYFFVKVYGDYHPEIGKKIYLYYAIATVPPLIEGYFRIRALAHFPSDIFMGLVIGGVTGIVVPELHRYKDRKFHLTLSTPPGSTTGFGLCYDIRKTSRTLLPAFNHPHS